MKKIHTYIVLIFALLALSCSEDLIDGEGSGTLKGSVRLQKTNEPMENVKITTTPSTETVYTDKEGNFEIRESIPIGDYSVKAEKSGYVTEFEAINIQKYDQVVSVVIEMITDESLNSPPSVPELLSPENNEINVAKDVVLKWNSEDPEEDKLTYTVLLDDNYTNEQKKYKNITADSLSLKNLRFGTTYTWQVIVSDSINTEVYSKASQFTIRKNPEFRYHYVQREKGNFVIRSTDLDEVMPITDSKTSSWRPRKNNIAMKVAFLQTLAGQTHLVTADLNGDNPHRVSQVPINGFRNDELNFAWHTDGSKFIFPSYDKLYKINYDGTGQHKIYETTDGSLISKVAWSYDGSKIAIISNDKNGYHAKLSILSSDGNLIETLIEGESGAMGGLDWNITGDKLLYTLDVSGYQSDKYRQLDNRIFLYDFKEQSSIDLSDSDKEEGTNDFDPQFSPNDSQILFTNTSNDNISERSVYSMDLNNNAARGRELIISDAEMVDYQ